MYSAPLSVGSISAETDHQYSSFRLCERRIKDEACHVRSTIGFATVVDEGRLTESIGLCCRGYSVSTELTRGGHGGCSLDGVTRWLEVYRPWARPIVCAAWFEGFVCHIFDELFATQLGSVKIVNHRMEGCLGAHRVVRLLFSIERRPPSFSL